MTDITSSPQMTAGDLAAQFVKRPENNRDNWPARADRVIEGCYALAALMVIELGDNAELRQGLCQLLEARKQFLLAAIT